MVQLHLWVQAEVLLLGQAVFLQRTPRLLVSHLLQDVGFRVQRLLTLILQGQSARIHLQVASRFRLVVPTAFQTGHLSFLADQRLNSGKLGAEATSEGCGSFTMTSFQCKQEFIYALMKLCLRQELEVLVKGFDYNQKSLWCPQGCYVHLHASPDRRDSNLGPAR